MVATVSIGERLKALREAKGLTQKALAERSGVGLSALFQIEQGVVTNPRLDTLRALARALGVSLDELAAEG